MADSHTHIIIVQMLPQSSVREEVHTTCIIIDWRKTLLDFLLRGILSDDKEEVNKLKNRMALFVIIRDVFYKHSFMQTYLCCLSEAKGHYVLYEIHEGCYGPHIGGWH